MSWVDGWQRQKRRWEKFTWYQIARPRMLANLARNLRECSRGETVLRSRPWNVIVELTANCNLKCAMCTVGQAGYDPAKEMNWNLFTRIERELFPLALMVDLRSQGESTIARHWQDALEFIRPYRARFSITTNGMKITPDLADRLASQHFAITVSFDGATKSTFEAIRGGSDFERICNNVRLLAQARRKYRGPERNLALRVTAQRDNLEQLPAIVELAHQMGVRVVHIQPICIDDDRNLKHHIVLARQQLLQAQKRGHELGLVEVEIPRLDLLPGADPEPSPPPQFSKRDTFCNDPWKTINIAYDGRVYACCYGNMPLLGDLNSASFEEIWNGDRYRRLRADVNSNHPWPECRICYPKNRYG